MFGLIFIAWQQVGNRIILRAAWCDLVNGHIFIQCFQHFLCLITDGIKLGWTYIQLRIFRRDCTYDHINHNYDHDKDRCHSHAVSTIFNMLFTDSAYQFFRIWFMFLFPGILRSFCLYCLAFIFLEFLTEFHFHSPPSSSVSSEWTAWWETDRLQRQR